jgi:hypothetical protein
MKTFVLTVLLTAMIGGIAAAAGYNYSNCANSNSKACMDARAAFAEHHNGQQPERYYDQWYQGRQGRWNQKGSDWSWEGARGDTYTKGHQGWQWSGTRSNDEHRRD